MSVTGPVDASVPEHRAPDREGGELVFKLIVGVATTIGTGIGAAAFLTFVGGAIMAARFRGVGVSGTSAVALIGKGDLLAAGADQLVAFVTASALAAFVLAGVYVVAGLAAFPGPLLERRWARAVLLAAAVVGASLYDDFHAHVVLSRPDKPVFIFGVAVLVMAAFAVEIAAGPAISAQRESRSADGVGSLRSRAGGRHIAIVASVAFAATMLFGAAETYSYNLKYPEVRAAAVVVPHRHAVIRGYYVGTSDGRIYIARRSSLGAEIRSQRLEGIRQSDVSEIAIGATLSPRKASQVSVALCNQMVAEARSETAGALRCIGP